MAELLAAQAGQRLQAKPQYRSISRMERRRPLSTTPPVPGDRGYEAELERLAELNTMGVLTDDEFNAKTHQLLGI